MKDSRFGWAVPMLRSRSQLWGEAAGPAVGVIVFILIGVLAPWLRWSFALPMVLVLGYALVFLTSRAMWIDLDAGIVTRRSWLIRPTSYPLASLTDVSVVNRGASSAAIRLVGPGLTLNIPVVSQTLFGSVAQTAESLRTLIEIITPLPGGSEAVGRLRKQLKHVEHGGSTAGSPLVDEI